MPYITHFAEHHDHTHFAEHHDHTPDVLLGTPSSHASWDEAVSAARDRIAGAVLIAGNGADADRLRAVFDAGRPAAQTDFTFNWRHGRSRWTVGVHALQIAAAAQRRSPEWDRPFSLPGDEEMEVVGNTF